MPAGKTKPKTGTKSGISRQFGVRRRSGWPNFETLPYALDSVGGLLGERRAGMVIVPSYANRRAKDRNLDESDDHCLLMDFLAVEPLTHASRARLQRLDSQ